MYIKEIGLRGFRTYRDPCVFRFSPGYNVIVGLNGSGKSNVLLAVTFALAETLEHANRSSYLYRGNETSLEDDFSAYVELVFGVSQDSNAQCLLDSREDLRLKRIFSRTKDLYLVNGKNMSRKDYRQFIESLNLIHFSKQSASYRNDLNFIVKQGAVGKICNMTVEERLTAFRDIIGHRAFDCKIEESAKLLQDYQVMANSVDGQLSQISRKVESLELQKGGQEWEALDRERRVLQAKLLILKAIKLKAEVIGHETEERKQAEVVDSLQGRVDMLEMDISELRESLAIIESMNDLSTKRAEIDALEKTLEDVKGESSDLHKEISSLSHDKEELEREINTMTVSIDTSSRDLNVVESEYITINERIQDMETQLRDVIHKQNSPGEKTLELIARLEQQIQTATSAMEQEESHKVTLEVSLSRCLKDQEVLKGEISKYTDLEAEKTTKYMEITRELETLTDTKRSKQNSISSLLIKQSSLRLAHGDAEKNFNKVALSQKQTLGMIEQWLESDESRNYKNDYLGVLIGIITVPESFKVAIEQALGSKLFTVVLRTMVSAKALIKYIESSGAKYNNIRIVALEVLQPIQKKSAVCDIDRNVAMPLVECLKYPDEVAPLVHSLTNGYCLVENVEVASRLTRDGFNCVTMDGQMLHHKGTVSGGYVNVQESVLKLYDTLKHIEKELKDTEKNIQNHSDDLKLIEAKQEELSKSRNTAKSERSAVLEKLSQLQISLQQLKSHEESIRHRIGDNKKARLTHQIKVWTNQIDVFKKNMSSPNEEIAELTTRQKALQEELSSLKRKKSSLEARVNEVTHNWTVLREKRNAASKRMITIIQMLEAYTGRLGELESKTESLQQSYDSLKAEYMKDAEESELQQQKRDELCTKLHNMESELSGYRSELGDISGRHLVILQTIASMRLAIKDTEEELGRTEQSIISQAESCSIDNRDEIMSKIAVLNKQCSRYDFSNRICTQDPDSVKAEYCDIKERYDRITKSHASILKSIKALKSQKDANLLQMLNQLNDKLSQTFEELVPNGRIRAVLLRRDAASLDPSSKLAICLPECFVESPEEETFIGLDLKVAFGNATEAMQPLYQLSGGQKTLVSLAFILAAQRLQAAPFYLLDEIDAALDENYRENVTKLLQKQCQDGSQCILTTFRPELLGPGETFYEIRNEAGTSVMHSIDINEALSVITRCTKAITNCLEDR